MPGRGAFRTAFSTRHTTSAHSGTAPPHALALARMLAELLDRRFTVPGLGMPVGLDPLIGLIPGFGDLIASALGAVILMIAARCHVPRIVLIRMTLNTALNGAIGVIPIAGDAFSFWFRSNLRNVALLEKHAGRQRASTVGDWAFVIGLLLGVLAMLAAVVVGFLWLMKWLWTTL